MDRRKVLIVPNLIKANKIFENSHLILRTKVEELVSTFSEAEVKVIERYLVSAIEIMKNITNRLNENQMDVLTTNYLTRAETWLLITTLAYFLMNGAQIFETAVLVPKWTAAPPDSFQYFKGKYGMDLKLFWIIVHSLHEITFIIAIVFCWKIDPVRNWLLIFFAIHFAVRAWTLIYFAPNIIHFQKIANGAGIPTDLLSRATLWRNLNYIRVGIFIAVSLGLIPLCMKLINLKSGLQG